LTYTCREVIEAIEAVAPPYLAEENDRIGLQIGRPDQEVSRVLVSLEVTREVLEEAQVRGAQLIVSHHPLIWQPLARIREDDPAGALVAELLRRRISVYVAHTNWDRCAEGVSACLARALGLERTEVLEEAEGSFSYKLVTFVPEGYEAPVIEALAQAGAGRIGAYRHCSFRSLGIGTFRPLEGASPFLGKVGQKEEVREYRLEMVVPRPALAAALSALRRAHPYEEPAYDVYPLAAGSTGAGLGVVGELAAAVPLEELAERLKRLLGTERVRVAGPVFRQVRRLAVIGGSGGGLVAKAVQRGAEALVTGDVKHHEVLNALAWGLAVIDAGHGATERVSLPQLAEWLRSSLPGLEVWVSTSADPWQYV
jgi:dinuclear metal center YbgI/SA1388 family protein